MNMAEEAALQACLELRRVILNVAEDEMAKYPNPARHILGQI
jgi:hypothetical protein